MVAISATGMLVSDRAYKFISSMSQPEEAKEGEGRKLRLQLSTVFFDVCMRVANGSTLG